VKLIIFFCYDLGEAITGDVPAFNKTKRDEIVENKEVSQLICSLPQPYKIDLIVI